MSKKPSFANKIQVFGILVILIIFPLMSWYYLKTGYNYQMDARGELKDYGKTPIFSLVDNNGKTFTNDSIGNTMAVISFLGKDENMDTTMLGIMQKLNTQFGDNRNLKLLIGTLQPEFDSPAKLNSIFEKYNLADDQHTLLTGDKAALQKLAGMDLQVPKEWIPRENEAAEIVFEKIPSIEDYPFFVLIDRKQTINNYYKVNSEDEVKRMVEHIAIMLPRDIKPDIFVNEQKEK